MFPEAIASHGTGLALEIGGGVTGPLLGAAAASLIAMAVAMTLVRTLSLAVRANKNPQRHQLGHAIANSIDGRAYSRRKRRYPSV